MFIEQRSLKISLGLHIALILIAAFGLPVLLPDTPEPQPLVMTVDILPISEMTNVRPSQKPIQKKQATEKPQPPAKEKPKPQPVEKKPEPEPEEEEFDPMKEPEEVVKKEEKKPEPKKEDDFEKLLNDLKQESEKVPEKGKDKVATEENKTVSDAPYDETMPLSLSEEDALRSAYIPCWSAPAGAMNAEQLIVVVRAQYNPDGSLIDVKLEDSLKGRYNSDTFFRAAADAGLRAVRHPRCNPLKNLPATVYPKLKDTKITFDPRLMLQ